MVWSKEGPADFESDKIAAFVIPYTRGHGLDVGCGMRKVWPGVIGVDNNNVFSVTDADIRMEGTDLSIFGEGSLDFIYSSHMLEDLPPKMVPGVLAMWGSKIKVGGYLVLYVPSANLYPLVGEPGANVDHKWNIYPGDIATILRDATDCGWTQVEDEERGEGNEYSLFEVYQKRDDGAFVFDPWVRNPGGRKRALVVRYGAIGDQIMASSPLPALKRKGYHITYNTTPKVKEVVKFNPNIDDFLLQDPDQVPNQQLGPYWDSLRTRYDLFVNLCESIEGTFLALPGRLQHMYSQETRNRLMDKNYLEHTHDIAAVPYEFDARFYTSREEKEWAKEERRRSNGPIVVWAINGSSPHKVYPFTQVVIGWLVKKTPAHVYIVADPGIGKALQEAILSALGESKIPLSHVHPTAGDWSIRQALTFAKYADVVVGPETGILNAAAMEESVKKVVYLSHSSQNNLTKHWKNTVALEPENCPCYPCHMMHYNWNHCHRVEETAAALCASNVTPERIFKEIALALGAQDVSKG